MTIESRSYELDLEVRDDGDGRTICGICVPYNVEQRIHAGLTEVFLPGAFDGVTRAAHRVKLLMGHDSKGFPLGRAHILREDASGLYGEFRVSKTDVGDQALELVRDGVLTNLSVGFQPLKDNKRRDGIVERVKAHLAEVSLVTFGAYGDKAAVAALREVIEKPNLAQLENVLAKIRK
jgi:HK97 family phage prohead protease